MTKTLGSISQKGIRTSIDISKLELPKTTLSFEGITDPSKRHWKITKFLSSLFEQYGLSEWRFKGYDSAKTRAGICYGAPMRRIGLSKHFVLNNTAEEIQNTIVHEVAHAIDNEIRGFSNHDDHWRKIALALGDDGHRCYDNQKVVMPTGKFLYVCPNEECKREVRYHKRKNNTACGVCCKKYNRGRYHETFKLVYLGVNVIKMVPKEEPAPLKVAAHGSPKGSNEVSDQKHKTKSDRMREIYDSGITDIAEISRMVGAHYSHTRTIINRHKTGA